MPLDALRAALREGGEDDVDTGIYQRTNEVDALLAMIEASEASGSVFIEID